MTRFSMPVTDVRLSGVLHTVTWNTFCCSKRLPTSRPASLVAGLQAVSLGLVEVDLDLDVGLVELPVHPGRRDAVDARNHLLDAGGRRLERRERRPEDPDGDVVGRARVEMAHAVVQIRAHALGDAGIGGDGLLDLRHGGAVVGPWFERHPEL